jgi:hypothetical protein
MTAGVLKLRIRSSYPNLIGLLLALVLSQVCHAGNDATNISAMLFPETKTWPLVSASPAVSPDRFEAIHAQLLKAYKASALGDSRPLEGPECSFIEKAFGPENLSSFHVMDVDGDGTMDIVYAGSAQCTEGDATIVWFASGDDYIVRQQAILPLFALGVAPDKKKISSVESGCCGDPISTYYLGNFENMRRFARIRIMEDTILPTKLLEQPVPFKNGKATVLRSTPLIQNHYDKDQSMLMAHAVYGNILRKYLPGTTGSILAYQKDKKGRQWLFVKLDPYDASVKGSFDNEALSVEAPYAVDAGWVSISSFKMQKRKKETTL